ncbi:hypothetical protein [Bacillus massiliigorillae]|uniref:hypothetical protein n=1 Tax=Bacillus massiliigorillae TaxID=1243664 RepID=UPI0003A752F8|nr:hypothetical protein [Bacillus massiliigorillae]
MTFLYMTVAGLLGFLLFGQFHLAPLGLGIGIMFGILFGMITNNSQRIKELEDIINKNKK